MNAVSRAFLDLRRCRYYLTSDHHVDDDAYGCNEDCTTDNDGIDRFFYFILVSRVTAFFFVFFVAHDDLPCYDLRERHKKGDIPCGISPFKKILEKIYFLTAALDCSTRASKAFGSLTAMSARTLRFNSMLSFLRPLMNLL